MAHIYSRLSCLLIAALIFQQHSQAQCSASVVNTNTGSKCGAGSVTLSGAGSAGTSLVWYDVATGGVALAFGDTFRTPVISDTTVYYAAAATGTLAHAGADGPGRGTNWGSTNLNSYMIFSVTQPLILQSVTVYPTAGGTITVGVQNSAGNILQQSTFSITLANGNYSYVPLGGGSNTTIGTGVVLPLNFSIPAGTGYRLVQLDNNSTVVRNTSGVPTSYYNSNVNGLTITGNWVGSSGGSLSYWYNFYDWVVATGDSSQCESTRVPVQAIIKPVPTVNAGGSQTVCAGTPLTLGAGNSADTYLWSTGAQTQTISVTTTGSYWVRGTNAASGCSVSDTVRVSSISAPSVASITASQGTASYTLTAIGALNATGYLWDFGDGSTSTDPSPQHVYGTAGNFTVRLCLTNACYTSCTGLTPAPNTQYVSGTLVVTVTGIDQVADETGLQVYPVPSHDVLHISVHSDTYINHITAINSLGEVIAKEDTISQHANVLTGAWPNGIYLISISTDKGTTVRRITVAH